MNTEIKVSMLISFGDCIDEDDKYCMKKIQEDLEMNDKGLMKYDNNSCRICKKA